MAKELVNLRLRPETMELLGDIAEGELFRRFGKTKSDRLRAAIEGLVSYFIYESLKNHFVPHYVSLQKSHVELCGIYLQYRKAIEDEAIKGGKYKIYRRTEKNPPELQGKIIGIVEIRK